MSTVALSLLQRLFYAHKQRILFYTDSFSEKWHSAAPFSVMARLMLLLLTTFLVAAELSSAASFWDNLKLDCGVSVWSDWEPTINGYRNRTRKIYRQPQNGGAPCPNVSETDKGKYTHHASELSFLCRVCNNTQIAVAFPGLYPVFPHHNAGGQRTSGMV